MNNIYLKKFINYNKLWFLTLSSLILLLFKNPTVNFILVIYVTAIAFRQVARFMNFHFNENNFIAKQKTLITLLPIDHNKLLLARNINAFVWSTILLITITLVSIQANVTFNLLSVTILSLISYSLFLINIFDTRIHITNISTYPVFALLTYISTLLFIFKDRFSIATDTDKRLLIATIALLGLGLIIDFATNLDTKLQKININNVLHTPTTNSIYTKINKLSTYNFKKSNLFPEISLIVWTTYLLAKMDAYIYLGLLFNIFVIFRILFNYNRSQTLMQLVPISNKQKNKARNITTVTQIILIGGTITIIVGVLNTLTPPQIIDLYTKTSIASLIIYSLCAIFINTDYDLVYALIITIIGAITCPLIFKFTSINNLISIIPSLLVTILFFIDYSFAKKHR